MLHRECYLPFTSDILMINWNTFCIFRNERERNRVKLINHTFVRLQQHLPEHGGATSGKGGKKTRRKLSKVDTLRGAIEYIRALQDLLGEDDCSSTLGGMLGGVPKQEVEIPSLDGTSDMMLQSPESEGFPDDVTSIGIPNSPALRTYDNSSFQNIQCAMDALNNNNNTSKQYSMTPLSPSSHSSGLASPGGSSVCSTSGSEVTEVMSPEDATHELLSLNEQELIDFASWFQ